MLVPLSAPGLGEDTGQQAELHDLAVDLTRIMLLSPVLFAVSGMFMGILNARHHFLTPALAPMFYNAAIIVGALISRRRAGAGVRASSSARCCTCSCSCRRCGCVGMRWQPIADWRDRAVREVGRADGAARARAGGVPDQLHFIATSSPRSSSDGAISAVNFAWLIVMTPLGLFGMAISTAAFPRMAEQAARDERRLRDTLSRALRLILYPQPAGQRRPDDPGASR